MQKSDKDLSSSPFFIRWIPEVDSGVNPGAINPEVDPSPPALLPGVGLITGSPPTNAAFLT